MDSTTSHYADCTIYTRSCDNSDANTATLYLNCKYVPYFKVESLSMMGAGTYVPTECWNEISARLINDLPAIYGIDGRDARLCTTDERTIEIDVHRDNLANAVAILRDRVSVYGMTVSVFAGSLH